MVPATRKERRRLENETKKRKSRSAVLTVGLALSVMAGTLSAAPANAATPIPDSFAVQGAGWGHGVGMSQYGALGMAQEGYSATQILEHYYNPAKVTSSTSYASSDINVQLLKTGSTTITPAGGKIRVKNGASTYESSAAVSFRISGSDISFTINGATYTGTKVAVEWEGTRYWPVTSSATTVSIPGADAESGTGTYRHGKINVSVLNGQLNLVNSLRLNDEYLYGLAEVPSSWDAAALQAQAIAGRTYAMRNMGSLKTACECNVYDEVASQKFTGWKKENEGGGVIGKRWKDAVDATGVKSNGVPVSASVVTYNGGLIEAVYSSSTGGFTRAGKSVWVTDTPYLQSRDDHWALKPSVNNPNASWTTSISQKQAASAFGLGNVSSVAVAKTNEGIILSATAKDSNGQTKTITGGAFVTAFPVKAYWINAVVAGSSSSSGSTGSTKIIGTAQALNDVNLRAGEGTSYAILDLVPANATVSVYGSANGWTKVSYKGKIGYIYSIYLSATKPPAVAIGTGSSHTAIGTGSSYTKPVSPVLTSYTTTIELNYRSGPGLNYQILGFVTQGGTVVGTGKKSGIWYEVKVGSSTAWMSSDYLRVK